MKTSTLVLIWVWLLLGLAGLGLAGWVVWQIRGSGSTDASAITAASIGIFACGAVVFGWSGPVLAATVSLLRRRAWGWSLLYRSVMAYTALWALLVILSLSALVHLALRASTAGLGVGALVLVLLVSGGFFIGTLVALRSDPPARWVEPAPGSRVHFTHH